MVLILVSPPAVLAVSEEAVWDHLRLSDSGGSPSGPADQEHVRRLLDAAIGELDGPDGLLGRALITQSWRMTMDCFPRWIELPLPPLQAVTAITYLDTNGAVQTLPVDAYSTAGIGGHGKAEIAPVWGTSWPSARDTPGAVSVTFVAGYGDAEGDVPALIRAAILETIASRYAFRESIAAGTLAALPRSAVEAIESYRMRAF